MKKKSGDGAAKKLAGSSALRDKIKSNKRKLYFIYSSLGKIVSFYGYKDNHFTFLLFYFCSFTLIVCGEKNILPNLTNSQEPEPGFFGPIEPEPIEKEYQETEPEPLGKKIRSWSRSR